MRKKLLILTITDTGFFRLGMIKNQFHASTASLSGVGSHRLRNIRCVLTGISKTAIADSAQCIAEYIRKQLKHIIHE